MRGGKEVVKLNDRVRIILYSSDVEHVNVKVGIDLPDDAPEEQYVSIAHMRHKRSILVPIVYNVSFDSETVGEYPSLSSYDVKLMLEAKRKLAVIREALAILKED